MTEAKPNVGNNEHRDSVDGASQQCERTDNGSHAGSAHKANSGATREPTIRATDESSGDDDDDEEEIDDEGDEESEEEDDEEGDDDEPRLKYARLTQHLGTVYRNGDSTSTFLVAGDKMIIGTHKGNIVLTP
jgi:hypothetical protein